MKKNIAVMAGGSSAEAGISLNSAKVVCEHLDKEKYNIYKILIEGNDWVDENSRTRIDKNNFSLTISGSNVKFDAVFVAIHGTPAEDGKLQGYLDMLGIPYNCCGVLTASLTFDKHKTKEYLTPFGVLSPKAIAANTLVTDANIMAQVNSLLSYPIFVKPNKNGSSYGASKVNTKEELESAIKLGFEYDDEILIEEFIQGTEVTCGVITYQDKVIAMPLTEIRSKSAFFDFKAKYEGNSKEVTPAEIDTTVASQIQNTAVFIYKQLDFKGMCRIDFIIRDGKYYMLEVNSVPGLSAESIVPQQARAMGLTLTQLFGNSIENCLKSNAQ